MMKGATHAKAIPAIFAVIAIVAFVIWLLPHSRESLKLRVPGTDAAPGGETGGGNPILAGKVIQGNGQSANLPGSWPQFRGPNRDGISTNTAGLSRDWKTAPPRELWSLDVGEGYAGVAIGNGRVYLLDYDRDAKQSALRCLSLADGKETWRFSYPLTIKRNHGMTRTVPTVTDKYVVALDSKCNVLCLDSTTGELKWTVSLVREFGAMVPEWYAGQCPLVDGEKVILAPGGKNALLLALDLATGKPLWQTPNPHDWKMTHSSIMPMHVGQASRLSQTTGEPSKENGDGRDARPTYVYCANKGVVGVDARDGSLLWETTDWKIGIATVPSPVPLPDGKIFLTGGYGAGSLMLQLQAQAGRLTPRTLFKLTPEVFGATQHTPILKDGHLYGARADGRFVCLDLNGKVVWASGSSETFGLGGFLIAGDLILAMNDAGKLRLMEASPAHFNLPGEAQVLTGRESWAPLAIANGRLIARDLTRLICLEITIK